MECNMIFQLKITLGFFYSAPLMLRKIVSLEVLQCYFVHRHERTILVIYSKFSYQTGSNDISFISLGILWAKQVLFNPFTDGI